MTTTETTGTNQYRAFKLLERLGVLPSATMQEDMLAMLETIVDRLERIEQDRRR